MSSTDLPVEWVVSTILEHVPAPIDIGQTAPRSLYARWTHVVRNGRGGYVAASGDWWDAVNQALSICQATEQPYDSELWTHDDDVAALAAAAAQAMADAWREVLNRGTPEEMFHDARRLAAAVGYILQPNPYAPDQVMVIAPNGDSSTHWTLRDAITRHWVPLEQQP